MHIHRYKWRLATSDAVGRTSNYSVRFFKPILQSRHKGNRFDRNANIYTVNDDGVGVKVHVSKLKDVYLVDIWSTKVFSAHPFYGVVPSE